MNDAPDSIDPLELDVADLNELLSSMRQVQEELEAKVKQQRDTIVFVAKENEELRLRIISLEARLDERRRMMEEGR